VIDEYGTVQGLLTRTDLLEAVAGRLPDIDIKSESKISRQADGSFIIDAATPLSDVIALLGLKDLTEQDFVTLAGLVLTKLDHGPQAGERVSHDGWTFEILEVDGTRIKRIKASFSEQQKSSGQVSEPNCQSAGSASAAD
jgi:putative hemolysin